MNKTKNMRSDFWEYVESENTKTSKKVYNWLDHDNLSSILVDHDTYWIELTTSLSTMPNYVYNYIKNFMKKKGYKYLYDVVGNN